MPQVTGEVGPTMLFGVTSGDGAISSMSSQTSAMVQRAVEAARSSAQPSHSVAFRASCSGSSGAVSAQEAARWKQNEQQVAVWSQATQEQQQQQSQAAAAAAGGGCGCGSSSSRAGSPAATRQLVINAGWGRVELKAMGWMDGLQARMAQQAKQQQSG